jgi:hypothetical protein
MTRYILLAIITLMATTTRAQDMDHVPHTHQDTASLKKNTHRAYKPEITCDTLNHRKMSSQFSLDLPMNRDGSGTSWVPDQTPMYMYMIHGKAWMHMINGSIFARYNKQDLFNKGSRGGSQFDAPNWLMYMAQRKVGKNGLFAINTMFSLDPFLVGNGGYRLLYQTGESYKGSKVVDRQHPHDLFAELSIAYTQRVAENTDLSLSVGYPGEPALGPPVFMHRLSAINNPDAPLSHHYADATHITFGTATLGLRYKNIKLEGSVFTGREPDEFRYGFDKARFDSYSVRLSVNPSKEWALQVSNGWLKGPEDTEPQENVKRLTGSAIHTKKLNDNDYIATTLVYGQNTHNGHSEPAMLIESSLQLNKSAVYGRYEYVQKSADELDLGTVYPGNPNFRINALTVGTNRILTTIKQTNLTLGVQATANFSPSSLISLYGTAPIGFQAYLRIAPSLVRSATKHTMKMAPMEMSGGMVNTNVKITKSNGHQHTAAAFPQFEDVSGNGKLSVRFNEIKNNTVSLVAGQSQSNLLILLKLYLEVRDKLRADSLSTLILKNDISTEIKYQLSLTYFQYLGTTETKRFFLSGDNNIRETRNFLVHRNTTEIKNNNRLTWARYYNLTQLDSAYYKLDPSDSVRLQMSEHYNSLAYSSLLTAQSQKALYYLEKSYRFNPKSKYYFTNYPPALLFAGEYEKAKELYLKYKDVPFDSDYPKYKDVFLEDFMEFRKAGLTIPHLEELTGLITKQ